MPTYPYNGKPPLTASIYLMNFDSIAVSTNLEIDKVYIINSNLIWISSPTENNYENVPDFKIHRVCQNGPPWDIGDQVDVLVKVLDKASDQKYFLISRRQYILMLD
jgi:hypothetical protein